MDFSIIYQLRTKRFWWLDVILYFAVAVLVATIFCYFIFSIKVGFEEKAIQDISDKLLQVGTQDQKAQEKEVLNYIKKINDFNSIFSNHQFASNIFAYMQQQTMPYIWFKQFSLDQKNASVQLTGEADNMDNLSRQVANFETNPYVKKVGTLSSTAGTNTKLSFNVNLSLDSKIFRYVADTTGISTTTSNSVASPVTPPSNNK